MTSQKIVQITARQQRIKGILKEVDTELTEIRMKGNNCSKVMLCERFKFILGKVLERHI
jgi:hypothetical protein